MRYLNLLIVSIVVALSGIAVSERALAVPLPDEEQAYANGDYKTAFAIWEPLAGQGSARAAMNIARMYERGEYVAQDPAMATEWYRKAAEQSMSDNAPASPVIAPTYVRPAPQPVYYPVVLPRPQPIGFGFRHHGRR